MNMKKLFLICLCFYVSLAGFCQKIDVTSLEINADLGKESYQDRAKKYLSTYKLNDNGELEITSYLQVGDTKEVMYNNLINWIVSSCTEAATAILYENEEEGRITTRCYFGKIANDGKSKPKEWVDIRPTLSVEVQDKEAIMKFILPGFEVMKQGEDEATRGFMGSGKGFCFTGDETPKEVTVWPIAQCYPYNSDCKFSKTTCYMAYVHAIECYKILKQQVLNAGYKTIRKKK
jgi:hypothetical protein